MRTSIRFFLLVVSWPVALVGLMLYTLSIAVDKVISSLCGPLQYDWPVIFLRLFSLPFLLGAAPEIRIVRAGDTADQLDLFPDDDYL